MLRVSFVHEGCRAFTFRAGKRDNKKYRQNESHDQRIPHTQTETHTDTRHEHKRKNLFIYALRFKSD